MNVFSKILKSRPSTFTTFSQSGAVENGFAPMPMTVDGTLAIVYDWVVPGGMTHNAALNGSTIQYTGKFKSKANAGSLELVFKPMAESGINIVAGPINISMNFSAMNAWVTVFFYDSAGREYYYTYILYAPPAVSHFAINVSDDSIDVFLNGVKKSYSTSSDLADINSVRISCDGAPRVYCIAMRPEPMSAEYCKDVYHSVSSFPTVSEVDAKFDALSFSFTEDSTKPDYFVPVVKDNATDQALVRWLDDPSTYDYSQQSTYNYMFSEIGINNVSRCMATGHGLASIYLITDSDMSNVVLSQSYFGYRRATKLSQSEFDYVSGLRISSYSEPYLDSTEGMGVSFYRGAVRFYSYGSDSTWIDVPDGTYVLGWPGFTRGASIFVDNVTVSRSQSMPAVAPLAYASWIIPTNPSETIFSGESFSIGIENINSANVLVHTGCSSVYVDGIKYVSGTPLPPGWTHIAWIPQAANSTTLNMSAAFNTIHSVSTYYSDNPESYIPSIFKAHIDPNSITASENQVVSISEQSAKVYSHDWSITAVD